MTTGCMCENWTIQNLSDALRDEHKDNKKIVVPLFQRGQRWNKKQEAVFVDSLIKGYPVGTMLFYRTVEDNQETYVLVDGLQRSNSIRKYMSDPTEFFYDDSISDEFCAHLCRILGTSGTECYAQMRTIISTFIKSKKTFKNIQYYAVALDLARFFGADHELIGEVISAMEDFFAERQDRYEKIASTVIPVIVYTGDEDNLPEIFERINSKGTVLNKYEIYAASWPTDKTYQVENPEIVEHVIRKYDALVNAGFVMHNYSAESMRNHRRLNIFEYLFGLSKFLVQKYDILGFERGLAVDEVNTIAFELANACLNDTDHLKILYRNFEEIDVNVFEGALKGAIDFVDRSISVITKFKGNRRTSGKPFHAKYQIVSLISMTFKEMYVGTDMTSVSNEWKDKRQAFSNSILQHYVYDILTKYWREGGAKKVFTINSDYYRSEISGRTWMVTLNSFLERYMTRTEISKVPAPGSEEYVFLNCVYLKNFTAMDQLSLEKYDVEHIAPKLQMKNLIQQCNGKGLPISCIANLCYLPQYINRSKKDRNFYQDSKYLEHIDLSEVEKKYSLTEETDLEWMDMPYESLEDFSALKEYYLGFCERRFEKMKRMFCASLGIAYEEIDDGEQTSDEGAILPTPNGVSDKKRGFVSNCIRRLAAVTQEELIKIGTNSYSTRDGKNGYYVSTSKVYSYGVKERYWFAYRRQSLKNLEGCENKYIIYGCKDETTIIRLPVSMVEEYLYAMRSSKDEEGNPKHWHVEFLKDAEGTIVWNLSDPEINEIDVTNYKI